MEVLWDLNFNLGRSLRKIYTILQRKLGIKEKLILIRYQTKF